MIWLLACAPDVPVAPADAACVPSGRGVVPIAEEATWILDGVRGGDRNLGDRLAAGDLDGDGLDDLAIAGDRDGLSAHVYVVLGSVLAETPPGRYSISDLARFVIELPWSERCDGWGCEYWFDVTPVVREGALYLSTWQTPVSRLSWSTLEALPPWPTLLEDIPRVSYRSIEVDGSSFAVCDVTGDGEDDLLVSDKRCMVRAIRLVPGPLTSDVDLASATAVHDGSRRPCGVEACADMDGDGTNDFVISSLGGGNRRSIGVFLGGPALVDGPAEADARIDIDETSFPTVPPEGIGDWDGDGDVDVMVAAIPGAASMPSSTVYLFRGEPGFWPKTQDVDDRYQSWFDPDGQLGVTGSLATDADDDGYPEMLVGRPSPNGVGSVLSLSCPIAGGDRDVDQLGDARWDGEMAGFGGRLITTSDVDGNGMPEMIFGMYGANAPAQAGAVYIVRR